MEEGDGFVLYPRQAQAMFHAVSFMIFLGPLEAFFCSPARGACLVAWLDRGPKVEM